MLRVCATIIVGLIGGYVALCVDLPLPWLIGSISVVATYQVISGVAETPKWLRQVGQLLLGAAIGLHFSPSAAHHASALAELIIGMAVFSVGCALVMAAVVRRVTHLDPATAFFACIPGGISEMAVLADRFGGKASIVTVFQSIRLMMVVFLVPTVVLVATGEMPEVDDVLVENVFNFRVFLLMGASLSASVLFQRIKVPNSWFIGPLLVGTAFSLFDFGSTLVPRGSVEVGQVLIGCALGSRFERRLLGRMGRLLPVSVVVSLVMVALLAALSIIASIVYDVNFIKILLGSAPGGIAEMGIIAKATSSNVAVVTSFHLIRLVFVLLLSAPIFRMMRRLL